MEKINCLIYSKDVSLIDEIIGEDRLGRDKRFKSSNENFEWIVSNFNIVIQ